MRGGISIVLVGRSVPDETVRMINRALPTSPEVITLEPFPATIEGAGQFADFIQVLCGMAKDGFLKVGVSFAPIWRDAEALRIMLATGGSPGIFFRLLKRSLLVLHQTGSTVVDCTALSSALMKDPVIHRLSYNPLISPKPPVIDEVAKVWWRSAEGETTVVLGTNGGGALGAKARRMMGVGA